MRQLSKAPLPVRRGSYLQYRLDENELSLARARHVGVATQADWAREAADAEEAISREHTTWRASRSSH